MCVNHLNNGVAHSKTYDESFLFVVCLFATVNLGRNNTFHKWPFFMLVFITRCSWNSFTIFVERCSYYEYANSTISVIQTVTSEHYSHFFWLLNEKKKPGEKKIGRCYFFLENVFKSLNPWNVNRCVLITLHADKIAFFVCKWFNFKLF